MSPATVAAWSRSIWGTVPKNNAAIPGDRLHRVLADLGWEIRRKSGGAVATWDDTEIAIPLAHPKKTADHRTIARLAETMGITKAEFLDVFFDRRPVGVGKPKAVLQQDEPAGPTKADARSSCARLRDHVDAIDEWLAHGRRDSEAYKRVMGAISGALAELRGWPPAAGSWVSPDDTGYRPSGPDSTLVGVARATGETAAAVKRGSTLTKWQHDERSAE